MRKLIILLSLIISCALCACESKNETGATVPEVESETVKETEDELEKYRESLELTMWTFHGQVMTGEEVPVVLADENVAMMQFSVDAFNYDPSYFVFIYINDELVDKTQYSKISTSVDITEEYLKEGEYTVRFVQYEDNTETGNVISEKIARYKVEW